MKGRHRATAASAPTPGSTPVNVPMVTPMKQKNRASGENARSNPMAMCAKKSIDYHQKGEISSRKSRPKKR